MRLFNFNPMKYMSEFDHHDLEITPLLMVQISKGNELLGNNLLYYHAKAPMELESIWFSLLGVFNWLSEKHQSKH
jgi:hypothetical protein